MTDDIVDQFQSLAREKDPSARSLLVRKVAAEYVRRTGHEPTDAERELFSSLVLDLYDQIDLSVRRDIITLLARTRHISTPLAEKLAGENDELVTTLYEYSPMLSQETLLQAARERSESVLRAIARRQRVPEPVVDALMSRGQNEVVCELLRNLGSDFSSNALLLCAIICQTSLEIQSLMAARGLADQVFQQRMRRHAEQGCPFLPDPLSRATLDGTLEQLVADMEARLFQTDELSDDPTRDELLVKINLGELTFDNLLETLISKEGKEDVIWLLKDAPGLSTNAMEHLLASETNRILTRLLLEQDVSVKTFAALTKWRVEHVGFPTRHVHREVENYRQSMSQKRKSEKQMHGAI
ncbi:DUF2336 domain-containing protein [Cohaesibacter marisflavi]|nr:DUF2336 domain-containing protein [Cohaesibacter marisflavi]